MTHVFVAAILLTPMLAACGDGGPAAPSPVPTATFTATVTGAVSATFEGRAIFGASSDEYGRPLFAVILGEDTARQRLAFSRPGHGRPGHGVYQFADVNTSGDPWRGVFVLLDGGELTGFFVARSGSLNIQESMPSRLRGTFSFAGEGYLDAGQSSPVTVTVSGRFNAELATAGATLLP